ncbi:MAG: ABC transporter substrate-binding protein, partial [Betaproteobacteria bacterium]|nr:ABC transporter substrate-binding protein [Betaproteobacteria bacterium]
WVGPYDDERLGLHKVAPLYAYPGWWEPGPNIDLHVNIKAYEALSPEYRAIIENAAAYAHTDMLAKYDSRNPAALKRLVAGGTKLYKFPKEIMDAAFKESMAMYSEISDTNPNWKKIYTDLSNFRRDSNLWFRLTEAANDDFMQAARL